METIIGVIGSGEENDQYCEIAESVGVEIARRGLILACGGLGGVMEAVCRGAKKAQGKTIGIIPYNTKSAANQYVDICIPTGIGEARNSVLVNTCDVIIALGGGFGTLSEISFALKAGKPVIGINTWDVSESIIRCENAEKAVHTALNIISSAYR